VAFILIVPQQLWFTGCMIYFLKQDWILWMWDRPHTHSV